MKRWLWIPLVLAGCAGHLVPAGGGFGFDTASSPERIDACAGALIALRGASEDLRAELDAPSYAVGGLGFNDGVIDRAEHLRALLEALRSGTDPSRLTPSANEAAVATTAYIDSYFRGLQDGAKLTQAAQVIAIVNGAAGTVKALAGLARLLAGATVEAGGLTYALAGAGAGGGGAGAAAAASASTAGIQAILAGVAVTAAELSTLTYRGGKSPNDLGKDGERRAGISGPKERIPSLTGTAGYRVPDKVTELTIEEVKNVLKLYKNNQLRDYLAYAQRTNRTFVLWVRQTTKLSKELNRYVADGTIKLERVL